MITAKLSGSLNLGQSKHYLKTELHLKKQKTEKGEEGEVSKRQKINQDKD